MYIKLKVFLAAVFVILIIQEPQTETKVFICMGKGSKRYHYDKYCRGSSRCSTTLKTVSLEKARAMGRNLCGWED